MSTDGLAGRLAAKVCLVTGTDGSIGRATALIFAREGAAVVGCDVDVEAAEQTAALVHGAGGSMVSLQPCLLDDPAECAKLVDRALREFGRLDVVFNLAGERTSANSRTSATRIGMPLAATRST
jgi:NAD(P)-dependent dehydrogenase (short-subunit alcohol dehydrogenase family)